MSIEQTGGYERQNPAKRRGKRGHDTEKTSQLEDANTYKSSQEKKKKPARS